MLATAPTVEAAAQAMPRWSPWPSPRRELDTGRTYEVDDLVGGESLFVATGVTDGALLRGPWRRDRQLHTEAGDAAALPRAARDRTGRR